MSNWHDGYVEANGIRIHYQRTGAGSKPAMLLLHGITDNGACWSRIAHDLEDEYDLVMTDARGHGKSGGVEGGFSLEVLAEDAAGVIRGLGLEKPYVFGHSMGAITAAALAVRYPELVHALLLEDPPFFAEVPQRQEQEQDEENWKRMIALRSLTPEQRLAQARIANPGWVDEENIPWVESKVEFQPEVLQHVAFFMKPWQEVVPRLSVPTLLIIGEPGKAIVTPEVAQEVARAWNDCEVVQIKGAGHCIHRDYYDETMQAVWNFLQRH